VAEVFEDHVCFVLLDHHLLEGHDVFVPQMLEESDLSDSGDWETVAFALHSDLLESDFVTSVDVDGLEDFAVCTSTDNRLIARLAIVNRFGGSKFGRKFGTRAWL
jgi:hypothetical protein